MTELERALVQLGQGLAFPEAPDVSAALERRLAAERTPRFRQRRRTLAIALAVVALAVAAAFAVPPARTAILELFGIRGASVQRVDTLPPAPKVDPLTARQLELGTPVRIEDGRPAVERETVLVPTVLGAPDAAYVSRAVPGKLSLVYGAGPGIPRSAFTGVGILVTQFPARLDMEEYIQKLAGQGTSIRRLTVDGHPALWLEGGPHFVFFRNPDGLLREDWARLAGNTLLVDHDGTLVRIEGEIDRAQAVEIAESLEPVPR
jgi:hypothetical protein